MKSHSHTYVVAIITRDESGNESSFPFGIRDNLGAPVDPIVY